MHYLRRWLEELHGRSGVSMAGLLPLAHTELRAWAENTGRRPQPHEVEALLELDAVLLSAGRVEIAPPDEEQRP